MGEFLSVPIKDKVTEEGENPSVKYASCGMQGWRKRMEDSHIADLNVGGKGINVFGVFDGHGGKEVAQWVKKNFRRHWKLVQRQQIAPESSTNFKAEKCFENLLVVEFLVDNSSVSLWELSNMKRPL